ncbi:10285_t:CDS:2, partial [Funneliformis geosporum]
KELSQLSPLPLVNPLSNQAPLTRSIAPPFLPSIQAGTIIEIYAIIFWTITLDT